ncbi:dihydroneopterin aldolase [Anaplasma phagocytophilum]|uniref:Dihydroneopterin aldolase n=2 Tax=Anaplasma phagocytophilum TaxID=948 RepID=A0A098GL33_ANAPH|nr:dihydroneopterin aldolase [Anaplasma phagocytophilum]CEH11236.1 Dihydroneopterin aldolase [Anaplasma phagocytophilum]
MVFQLNIEDLAVFMCIGVYNWERIIKQKVYVSINVTYSSEQGGAFLDYDTFSQRIIELLTAKDYLLLEDAISDVISFIVLEHETTLACEVKIYKPVVSFLRDSKSISISAIWNKER